ncbi:hypothetical protein EZV62_016057 [Acer yangbiense]|uniref:Retrotransposon gag domain-containing protein n=1 Tax=Acer yangbiense TaxID=1000413 RepID=A0A5C7HN77_9ROSI|nr:hypothetical protein EZV62_016057 [Acer yangbiense]
MLNNDAIERLERQLAENKGKEAIGRQTQGDGRRSRSSWREAEFSSGERWLHDEVFEGEMDDGSEEDARLDRRPRGRRPIYGQRREPWRGAAEYKGDRRRERHHSRGPRKPKVNFPHFNGGDPHEWLDKVEHYFQVYEVAMANRVSTTCIYLDGKANSWWRWIKVQYEQDGRQMGWTAFEREFLTQWGPSLVVNHHRQLAKLKQEGRVPVYIEEFRRLQTLVKGWSEESLLGTFIEGLKPWLGRELKLKQPQRLIEAMRMAEILEDSYYSDKKPFKESSGSKNFKSESNKDSWKGKGAIEDSSKKESKDVKKLNKEEVQERIKKGICFKCGEKWNKDHRCRTGKVFMIIDSSESDDDVVAEMSLNAMSGVSKPSTMRLMAWVGAAIEPFDVNVANGEKLKCEEVVHKVKINVQRVGIVADLHVLSLVGVDVVLGNAWLKSIGKVVTDFDAMTMEFKLGGRKRTWAALPLKEIKQCEAQMIERLCKGGAQCFEVVNDGDRQEGKSEKKNTNELQDELQRLLEKYDIVYQLSRENKVADALSRKEGSSILWSVYADDEAGLLALSGAEWRVWD